MSRIHISNKITNITICVRVISGPSDTDVSRLAPVSSPLIFNNPLIRCISYEKDAMIYGRIWRASKNTSAIILPIISTYGYCKRALLQQVDDFSIIHVSQPSGFISRLSNSIIGRTYVWINISKRIIGVRWLVRNSSSGYHEHCILCISSPTVTSVGTRDQILLW